ncbi:MAG: hypothetical protein WCF16_11860 [Alphaproteobacteria bacterium]
MTGLAEAIGIARDGLKVGEKIVVHRPIEGQHQECSDACWCRPHVFTDADLDGLSDENVAAIIRRREAN